MLSKWLGLQELWWKACHTISHNAATDGRRLFSDEDYAAYIAFTSEWCRKHDVDIWAYCLMPNHIHLIAVPGKKENLRLAIGEAHRRYTHRINFREGWRGHLWQERFSSFVMDEYYLLACTRYIEDNPVRANLVRQAEKWRWSSASAHISGQNDALVNVDPLLLIIKGDWRDFLGQRLSPTETDDIRKHAQTGRPLGDERFVTRLECLIGRELRPRKPGGKPKKSGN